MKALFAILVLAIILLLVKIYKILDEYFYF